jgi:hypothetical protein
MDKIRLNTAPGMFAQIRAKYRRKAKCVVDTEGERVRERVWRAVDDPTSSAYMTRTFIQEVPN